MNARTLSLPTDSKVRKDYPMYRGLKLYFPAALAGVARHSFISNEKHNPGEPMHHSRAKSADHPDCIERHTTDIGDYIAAIDRAQNSKMPAAEFVDAGGPEHVESCRVAILAEANALAWRALAWAQELHEQYGGAPLAPAARLPVPAVAPPRPDTAGAEVIVDEPAAAPPTAAYQAPPPAHTCAIGSTAPCAACDFFLDGDRLLRPEPAATLGGAEVEVIDLAGNGFDPGD